MAAHRYWRLQLRGTGGGANGGLGELQMRTSIGGGNVITGGTASASTIFSAAYAATKAFDGLTVDTGAGNGWAALTFGGSSGRGSYPWIQYDFGAGNEKDIQEIVIFCPGASGLGTTDMVTAWDFQYSDDNVFFTTQRSYAFDSTTPAWVLSTSRIYDVRPLGPIDIHNYTAFDVIRQPGLVLPNGTPEFPATPTNEVQVDGSMYYQNTWRGGLFKLAGTTTVLGFPAPRRVRLYAQQGGRIYAEQYTKPDGLFEFRNLDAGPWTVVGVDDTGTQNGVIYSHVTAVPM